MLLIAKTDVKERIPGKKDAVEPQLLLASCWDPKNKGTEKFKHKVKIIINLSSYESIKHNRRKMIRTVMRFIASSLAEGIRTERWAPGSCSYQIYHKN